MGFNVNTLSSFQLQEYGKELGITDYKDESDLKNKIMDDVWSYVKEVENRAAEKENEYKKLNEITNQYNAEKKVAEVRYNEVRSSASGKDDSIFKKARTKYVTACNNYSDADINSSIALQSWASENRFAAKLNNTPGLYMG